MRVIRALLPYTTAAVVLAALYLAWVFVSRWDENRRLERAAAAQQAKADQIPALLRQIRQRRMERHTAPANS